MKGFCWRCFCISVSLERSHSTDLQSPKQVVNERIAHQDTSGIAWKNIFSETFRSLYIFIGDEAPVVNAKAMFIRCDANLIIVREHPVGTSQQSVSGQLDSVS